MKPGTALPPEGAKKHFVPAPAADTTLAWGQRNPKLPVRCECLRHTPLEPWSSKATNISFWLVAPKSISLQSSKPFAMIAVVVLPQPGNKFSLHSPSLVLGERALESSISP
ncbi:predicted protein [Histoplasma capsulatum G186AR]|uniref:Uncharacterized protein n=1 Tax=Ajellomyces capsulatus (strain G186AR / H82 / ATCC MYA-2454 / RMSCC 2432) TaxID=447093 RepID=C0NCJ8_AJECG|nr:uncharacterized protein HCBG_00844 [Histoplasma capsulatum G186AR]EEH11389.1 predicted protein [Histoplasma capsulatum G186AR]